MKKPMIKAMAMAMAITMAISTPLTANAAGLADLYTTNDSGNGEKSGGQGTSVIGSDTSTGTGTGTIGATEEITDPDTLGNIVGIVVDKPEFTVEEDKTTDLSASVLMEVPNPSDPTGKSMTIAVNASNVGQYSDLVVMNAGGKKLEEVLSKYIVWNYSKKYLTVTIPNTSKSNVVTVKGEDPTGTGTTTITASVKGVSQYKATATVTVKRYSTTLDWKAVEGGTFYMKHTYDMASAEYLNRTEGANDELTWKVYEKGNNGYKTTKAATITGDGKLTLKTKGKTVYVIATSERGKTTRAKEIVIAEGNPIKTLKAVGDKKATIDVSAGKTVKDGADGGKVPGASEKEFKVEFTAKNSEAETSDYIKWEAKNKNLVEVHPNEKDEEGLYLTAKVTAKAPGSTTVTATATSGKKVSFNVKVLATLTGLKVVYDKPVYAGQSVQLKVEPTPSVSKEKVLWKIDATGDELEQMKKVATVNNKGVLQANKNNETTPPVKIVAQSNRVRNIRGAVTSEPLTITVKESTLTEFNSIYKASKVDRYMGQTLELKPDVKGKENTPFREMLSWSTSKESVASVKVATDGTGIATVTAGTTAGTATITASGLVQNVNTGKFKLVKKTLKVTVKQPVESIQLNKPNVTVKFDPKKFDGTNNKDYSAVTLSVSKRLPKKADTKATVSWSVIGCEDAEGKALESKDVVSTSVSGKNFKVVVKKTALAGTTIKVQALCMGATTTATIKVCYETKNITPKDGNKENITVGGTAIKLKDKFVINAKLSEATKDTKEEIVSYTANNNNVKIVKEGDDYVLYALKAGKTTVTAKTATKSAKITFTIKEKDN